MYLQATCVARTDSTVTHTHTYIICTHTYSHASGTYVTYNVIVSFVSGFVYTER